MSQARKSRCALRGLRVALAAAATAATALVAAVPGAAASPAGEEYSLNLPGEEEAAPPAPAPAAPVAPAPAPYYPPAPAIVPEVVAPPPAPPPPLEPEPRDVAAARRDVLVQLPAAASADRATAANAAKGDESGGTPFLLIALGAAGAGCVALTLLRLRRFTNGARRAPAPAPARTTAGQPS